MQVYCIKMRHSIETRIYKKVMDFYRLLKIWVKIYGINIVKNFLIVLKNLQRMQLLQKEQFKKQQKQLVI